MKTIGITGGIGMGKSKAAEILGYRGVPVVDTDVLARQLVEPGQPALVEIAEAFGSQVLDSQGRLDRAALARVVFSHPESRLQLERILHPRIRQGWMDQMAEWWAHGVPLAAVVIPLLFEVDAAREMDSIICVACSPNQQRQRLRSRGWSEQEIENRIQAQWPISKKMELSDYVVWTNGGFVTHARQIDLIVNGLGG